MDRLRSDNDHDLATQLEKCGEPIRLICTNCGGRKIAEKRCEKRWCPACAYYIAAARVDKYRAAAELFQWPLFLTLTIRNTPTPEGLRTIKAHWAKLRRRKLITEKVKSGIVGWEVTNKGEGWHPHLHALLDCRWLSLHVPEPQRHESAQAKEHKCRAAAEELHRLWCDIAGQDSASIRIRRGDPKALVEVLKYSVKGSELIESAEPPGPLIRLMLGMRLISTFGEIRKTHQDEDPEEETDGTGCPCGECGATGAWIPADIYQSMLNQAYDRRAGR